MSRRRLVSRRRRRAGAVLALALLLALVALAGPLFPGGGAAADAADGELVAQPYFGAPAQDFLGASPGEASGEVWATATDGTTLARYTDAGGWETVAPPVAEGGATVPGLEMRIDSNPGRTTPHGGIAAPARAASGPVLVFRDPGGPLRVAPEPPEAVLGEGEALFETEGAAPLLAAAEGPGGATRSLVVPVAEAGGVEAPAAVLSFVAGSSWSREPICVGFEAPAPECEEPPSGFRVLAIEAAGSQGWMLTKGALPEDGLELFRREATGAGVTWRQVELGPAGSLGSRWGEALPLGVPVAARVAGQPLTASEGGLWLDATLTANGERHDATVYYDIGAGEVTGSWCDLPSPEGLCTRPLEAELPNGAGRSFAFPPDGANPFGRRVVTGIGQGAILSLEGSAFSRVAVGGAAAGSTQGAALSAPDQGWLGATPPLHLTRTPQASRLQPWPVPFRRPLTAIAAAPEAAVAGLGSEALAVGVDGEVARYVPGLGWEPEFLLSASGARATPTLRAVAWPQRNRAYAVGDGAAMWVWQRETGLWEPDPAMPRNLVRANFTGLAFSANNPSRGYAVGKQGLLLGYGRSWVQEALPAGVPVEANFTSVAFAGEEAIASWKYPVQAGGSANYEGGVIVNSGTGWVVDTGAGEALGAAVPQRVAGLADGGAAIAGAEGQIVTRSGAGAGWEPGPGGAVGYPAALAAVREGSAVRALVSVAEGQGQRDLETDLEQVFSPTSPGQPPLLTDPYPLPGNGLVLRETPSGWRDEQNQSYPAPAQVEGQTAYDLPAKPDPVLALLVSPSGEEGWAVGGETGTFVQFRGEAVQTAGVLRYGPAAAPPANSSAAPIGLAAGTVDFAVGGNAQCAGPCADLSGTGIGPDRWLRSAVARAAGIAGLRGFLYTGPGVASRGVTPAEGLESVIGPAAFAREQRAYASRLAANAGTMPVFAAASSSDLDAEESLAAHETAFAGFGAPLGVAAPGAGVAPISQAVPGKAYYSFASTAGGAAVDVIVLDYSRPSLGEAQRCWLAGQLANAGELRTAAVVVGQRDVSGRAANTATDGAEVRSILVSGKPPSGCAEAFGNPMGASAYFFDYPEENRQFNLTAGGRSIPAYGTGTLGYVSPPPTSDTSFLGAGGFLVAQVETARRNAATNVAPVGVRLIPNIGSLALDATDGTMLRRSRPALFEALARRPLGGASCSGALAPSLCEVQSPDPYVPIPNECQGPQCATGVFPEYTFTSSNPEVADFVEHDPASRNPRNVLLVNEKPVADPASGLLCAFNAGATTVTVSSGGLAYSTRVTVLAGSVNRPCGTTPLRNVAAAGPETAPPPLPATAPAPTPAPAPTLPPPAPPATQPTPPAAAPLPPAPLPKPPPPPLAEPALFTPFFAPTVTPLPIVPIVPPPPPPAFQPTPPSGTSPVSATQNEEEDEVATEQVSHMAALRHRPRPSPAQLGSGGEGGGLPRLLPALLVLAAIGAAAGVGLGSRRHRRPGYAFASRTQPRRYR